MNYIWQNHVQLDNQSGELMDQVVGCSHRVSCMVASAPVLALQCSAV